MAFDARTSEVDQEGPRGTGRRRLTGRPRRIDILFLRLGDDIYLSGIPAENPRDWLVNLDANPDFVFHLQHDVVADLPARTTVVTDPAERRRVLAVFPGPGELPRDVTRPTMPTPLAGRSVHHRPGTPTEQGAAAADTGPPT